MLPKQSPLNLPAKLKAHVQQHSIITRSPGRINLIGEHTDYNEGYVLPAAIDKAAYLSLTPRQDQTIVLHALDLGEVFRVPMGDIKKIPGSWTNYILGVVDQFIQRGIAVPGFEAALVADIPLGAGLSSSAAVECATAMALNEWLATGLDKLTLVKMSQMAEHAYAGVQCGIMDQFASMFGKKDHVIRLDCRSLQYEYVPFLTKGIRIVLMDTQIKHSLASSEYNTRRQQCDLGVSLIRKHHPEVSSLRDVTREMLDEFVLQKDPLIYHRCQYVVEENGRLLEACEDLRKGDLRSFGSKLFVTHEGLSHLYQVSCEELDFLVDHVRNNPSVLGARMMGGGFGGCTLNLVREEAVDELIHSASRAYLDFSGQELKAYVASIEDGTSRIS